MNVIQRFTLRSLKNNKKWTAVTLLGLVISTAMLTAVSTFTASIFSLLIQETIATEGNWHAAISQVTLSQADSILESDFVDEAMLVKDVGYAQIPSRNRGKPYLFIRQLDEVGMKNYTIHLIEGRLPKEEGEILIPQHLESNGHVHYEIGDRMTLAVGKRYSPDRQELWQNMSYWDGDDSETGETFIPEETVTYTVVGIMERPDFERSWSPGYTAISYLDIQKLSAGDTIDVMLLTKPLSKDIYKNVPALAESIGLSTENVRYNSELLRYHMVINDGDAQFSKVIYTLAAVIILIIIIASVSLIYNAFAISVSERIRQLGILASVGATKKQKKMNVYFEGFLIGMIGIPIGILTGIAGIGITLKALAPVMDSFTSLSTGSLKLVVTPLSIIISVLLAAVTILISAWVPARRASKITPIDAIRQSKEVKLNAKKVKTSKLVRLIFGFEGEIALKNLKRSRRKYRVTVFSLIVSLVLFLTVSYYAELGRAASNLMVDGYNFDISVKYSDAQPEEIKKTTEQIAGLEGVTNLTLIKSLNGSLLLNRQDVTSQTASLLDQSTEPLELKTDLYCLDNESFQAYARQLGINPQEYQNPDSPKVIAINNAKGQINGKYTTGTVLTKQPGDEILFSYSLSEEESAKQALQIGVLTDQRPMGVLIHPFNSMTLITGEEVFDSIAFKLPNNDWERNQALYLQCQDANDIEEDVRKQTDNLSTGSVRLFNVVSQTESENNVLLFMGVFVYGFIILISLICIANIANTTATNMSLRRKEFAMLRSVGMTPGSFSKMIRFESIFYGLKALLYGLPISAGIAVGLHYLQKDSMDVGVVIPWKSYLTAILLIFAVVGITMVYAVGKIKKENIIDALKMDNE